MNRRTTLQWLSGAGLAAFLGTPSQSTAAEAPRSDKREIILLGPFSLGDWFRESKVKIDGVFNLGAPARDDIIKSFHDCTLFLLDQRIITDPKKPRFADGKKDDPRLLATGKLHHNWEEKGKSFTIQIAELSAAVSRTNYSARPPTQQVHVNVGLKTIGRRGPATSGSTIYFSPEKGTLVYDITGKLLRRK
jgi:hypothetical protein